MEHIAGSMRVTTGIVNRAMKTIWTLCKNKKWMLEQTQWQKGSNMKKKTIKRIRPREVSETEAEKRLFKTLRKMGLA